jgi:phage gp36-like protein
MPYSARQDIENVIIPAATLVELTDDESKGDQSPHVNERIAQCISVADREIDAMLLGLYNVPFTTVPDIIKLISAKLAAYYLWARRNGEKPDNINQEYKWSQRMLERIQKREIQLFIDAPVVRGEPLVSKTDADRTFSKSVLDKMP